MFLMTTMLRRKTIVKKQQSQISCAGATDTAIATGLWWDNLTVKVDDGTSSGPLNADGVISYLADHGISVERVGESETHWSNTGADFVRVELQRSSRESYWDVLQAHPDNSNPTLAFAYGENDAEHMTVCFAPAADCTPSEPIELLGSRNTPLTDPETQVTHNKLDYRLNGGPVQTFIASPEAITLENFLFELKNELGNVAPSDHWVFGNSAQGPAIMYETDFNNPVIIRPAGKNGIYDTSTTLELIVMDRPEDFVGYFIGDTVILHACGVFGFV